jgi:hypothetical protein
MDGGGWWVGGLRTRGRKCLNFIHQSTQAETAACRLPLLPPFYTTHAVPRERRCPGGSYREGGPAGRAVCCRPG